eukprot:3536059-Rhodomonas_salina.1
MCGRLQYWPCARYLVGSTGKSRCCCMQVPVMASRVTITCTDHVPITCTDHVHLSRAPRRQHMPRQYWAARSSIR